MKQITLKPGEYAYVTPSGQRIPVSTLEVDESWTKAEILPFLPTSFQSNYVQVHTASGELPILKYAAL